MSRTIMIERIKDKVENCSYQDLASIYNIVCSGAWSITSMECVNNAPFYMGNIHKVVATCSDEKLSEMYETLHKNILI